ncbi:tyrosine-type recombinase/integrase [Actinokineospora pegani]|uniref:tyrosine-type recombinase/integrase n=1 Tax=Actinokineospora pegani TaxID=2654637 RepID=UPI0012EABCA9|nr:site-specific integrase [Actinokineospora pegani]
MAHVSKTPAGKFRANWRDPSGTQRAKTFPTKREAMAFLVQVEASKAKGNYVSPDGGRVLFSDHAGLWMAAWNTEKTTAARDGSVMRNHVLPQWGAWKLGGIDQMHAQQWITDISRVRSAATVFECHRLASAVMRSAIANRLVGVNPFAGLRLPPRRKRETEQVISRESLRRYLLPAVPDRFRALVAVAGGAGLRWGEAIGLCEDAVNLDKGQLSVVRTVIEVSGHTEFKPYPKSGAGRRVVPLPGWVVELLREHMAQHERGPAGLIFTNAAGGALRRTLFRARVWKRALVRAGLLGDLVQLGEMVEGTWADETGGVHSELFKRREQAIAYVAKHQGGGLRFHDLRHSYATWLVDDGVPVNMVQRVLGHERPETTLALYTRRTDDAERILRALTGGDQDDDEGDDSGAVLTPC